MSREVGSREKELTHQVHREILVRCLEQVKTLAPILICSMKIFIHIIAQGTHSHDSLFYPLMTQIAPDSTTLVALFIAF